MRPGSSQNASQIDRPRPSRVALDLERRRRRPPHEPRRPRAGAQAAGRPDPPEPCGPVWPSVRRTLRSIAPRRAAPRPLRDLLRRSAEVGGRERLRETRARAAYGEAVGEVALGMPGPPRGRARRPPADHRLVDRFGRVATDLRVSLTDRCTLRCTYCMPPEGLDWLPGEQVLTDAEVIRLITIAVERLGVDEVRFTGGEPLLRRGLEEIVGATRRCGRRPARRRHRAHHERDRAGARGAPALRGRRAGPGQRLAGHAGRGAVRCSITHRDRLTRRARRAGRRGRRRARPGQGQHRAAARGQRRRGRAAGALGGRARLRAAVHRADAAGPAAAPGTATDMVTAEEILAALAAEFDADPDRRRRGARRRPRPGTSAGRPAGPGRRRGSASSPR